MSTHNIYFCRENGGASNVNEYPQYMFLWRNKKNINTFGLKKASSKLMGLQFLLRHLFPNTE